MLSRRTGLLGPHLIRPPAMAQSMVVKFLKSGGDLGELWPPWCWLRSKAAAAVNCGHQELCHRVWLPARSAGERQCMVQLAM